MRENTKKEPITVYLFNDEIGDFEELIIDPEVQLKDLLDEDFVLLFVDPQHFKVWLWHGYKTTIRTKFVAAKMAPAIRDKHGFAFRITAVDSLYESHDFLAMLGLAEARQTTEDLYRGIEAFEPRSSQLGILGTSYKVQLGLINGKWVIRLLKGPTLKDSYVFKDEDLSASGFPNQNLIVGWVLRTVAIPNINPHQIMKTTQALAKQAIAMREGKKDRGDRFPYPYVFKPPKPPDDLARQTIAKREEKKDRGDRFPYPYVFKPPEPPDDLALAPRAQLRSSPKKKIPEEKIHCQYCGRKLTKEEQLTHSCRKKPKTL